MGLFSRSKTSGEIIFKTDLLKRIFEEVKNDLKIKTEYSNEKAVLPITNRLKYITDNPFDYTDFVNYLLFLRTFGKKVAVVPFGSARFIYFEYLTDENEYVQTIIDTVADTTIVASRFKTDTDKGTFKLVFPILTIDNNALYCNFTLENIKIRSLRFGFEGDRGQHIYYKIINTGNKVELETGNSVVKSILMNDVRIFVADTLFSNVWTFSTRSIFTENLLRLLFSKHIGENSLINGRSIEIEVIGIGFIPLISVNPLMIIDMRLNGYIMRLFYDYLSTDKIADIRKFTY